MIRLRLALAVRMVLAHVVGLIALGIYSAIGMGEGFLDQAGFFTLIAGAFSLPIFVVALSVAIVLAEWIHRNLIVFILGGPVLVCIGWAIVAGVEFIEGIAIATGSASAAFAGLTLLRWPAVPEPHR